MLVWLLFVGGLGGQIWAQAKTNCLMSTPQISLAACMDPCWVSGGCSGDGCPCPQNLKGWCEMDEDGPDSWFSRWGTCVLNNCPDDGDVTNLMLLFAAQCEGTPGGPLNNDTVPYPLRDWAPKNTPKSSSSTATSSASQPTATASTDPATTASDIKATIDNISSSPNASGTTSSSPSVQDESRPSLSKAAIIGIAVGGTILLGLTICLIAFLLRRRRQKTLSAVAAVQPPSYDKVSAKHEYDKPELDGQAMAYHASKNGGVAATDTPEHLPVSPLVPLPATSPAEYAELDGGSHSRGGGRE